MQLRPEYECAAFDNVFSMSGMPEQNFGYHDNSNNDVNSNESYGNNFDEMRNYQEEKTSAPKRGSEDDNVPSNKRAKSSLGFEGFQQGGMAQHQQGMGMEGNLFNTALHPQSSDLHRAGLAQRHMEFATMNNNMGFGGTGYGNTAGLGLTEMRMEQETNRQQQSALMANQMALRAQQMGCMNQGAFASMDGPGYSGAFQRNQRADDNSFQGHNSGGRNPMSGFQSLQGLSVPTQPFLNNMFDMQLFNSRQTPLGLAGGTLPPMPGSAFFGQSSMTASGGLDMGQHASQGFASASRSGHAPPPAADSMPSLGPSGLAMPQLPDMSAAASAASSPQHQQHQQIVPMQQPSSLSEMTFGHNQPRQQAHANNQMLRLDNAIQPMLPPLEESNTPHYSQRNYVPFSIEEDANWLSEFQCFIRSEILELFRVSQQGIKVRNSLKSLTVNQVGIRCRFCAHLQHGTRANRSSCFPSKIDKIYQSFTMMLREHFPSCTEIPEGQKQRFAQLQNLNAQGASNAKGYWEHAAKKKGLVDVRDDSGRCGIHIFDHSLAQAAMIPPFGADSNFQEPQVPVSLVHRSDRPLVSNFLFVLMEQVYRVHLATSERKGNRKSLPPGMPGFGCKYCYEAGRMGLCRLFPARRRTIHTKIPDLYDHMKRCPLCPREVKDNLAALHREDNGGMGMIDQDSATRGREREFFERIWSRLGHQDESE